MMLPAGTRLGPYEVLALLGAGGMGEVYRARDTRLDRAVAIKVLPAALASDPQLRDRFEREAKSISALTHPNICTLYDVGTDGGISYLVMEHLEGETLAARLARGVLAVPDALKIATEIASALDQAHRAGIVHRDLKPGNVMLTKMGAKLLDFGLAKISQKGRLSGTAATVLATSPAESPLTAQGTILGTFQYMAPEQIEGEEADPRTDIFAFGAVFHEMLTGKRAFEGRTQASLMSAILQSDPPPVSQLSSLAPPSLDHVVGACLAKDRDSRIQTAHDVWLQLRWIAEGGTAVSVPALVARKTRGRVAWTAVAVATAALLVLAAWLLTQGAASDATSASFPIAGPPGADVDYVSLAPDGRHIVFAASLPRGSSQLWVSSPSAAEPQPLDGTDRASYPFWSPDSQSLAFFADGKLKRIATTGGPVTTLCDAANPRGGDWNDKGTIIFGAAGEGISRVPDTGGASESLVGAADLVSARWPAFLPDGRHFIYYTNDKRSDLGGIFMGDLDSSLSKEVLKDAQRAIYVSPGALVFGRRDALYSQPFDWQSGDLVGEAVPIGKNLWHDLARLGLVAVSASNDGTLLYQVGGSKQATLTWLDRSGRVLRTVGGPARDLNLDLSPDEQRLVVSRANDQGSHRSLWIIDLRDGSASRQTFDPQADEINPIWSPDGKQIIFLDIGTNPGGLFTRPTEGGERQAFGARKGTVSVRDWSRNGFVVYDRPQRGASAVTEILPVAGGDARSLEAPTTGAWFGRFSRDGRFIAYAMNASGRFEIHVQPFPATGKRRQVTTEGGLEPRWRGDGKELYYLSSDRRLMAVNVNTTGPDFKHETPQALFPVRVDLAERPDTLNHYVVTGDGKQFLFLWLQEQHGPVAVAVTNWAARRSSGAGSK